MSDVAAVITGWSGVSPYGFGGKTYLDGLVTGDDTARPVDIDGRELPDTLACVVPGLDPAAIFVNRVVFRLMDTRPGYRKLYPISALGVPRGNPVVTPDLLMLKVAEGTPRVELVGASPRERA